MRLRIKDICDYVSRGTTPDYVDEGANKVMNQATFSKGWIDESNIRYTSKTNKGARIMKGDLLMASTGGGVLGKVFFFDDDDSFYADSHVTIMRNSKGANLMKYLYYYFYLRYDEINATMVKGSTNQTELQRNYLLSYELDVPTLADQQRMVTYLDTKLSEIDHQVSLLTSKRDAYLRLKKSIINHAVTRGLDQNVKMKDSGIEWIGEVPEHWEVKRMKDCIKLTKGNTPKELSFEATNLPYLTMDYLRNRVGKEVMYPTETDGLLEVNANEILVLWDGANAGEFILSKEGYLGSTMALIQSEKEIISKSYLLYLLKAIESYSKYFANGTTIPHFNCLSVINRLYAFPPLPEQRAIATYLDDKCAKIDTIVSNLDKQISRYGDLKRSLIEEVITGKRAV